MLAGTLRTLIRKKREIYFKPTGDPELDFFLKIIVNQAKAGHYIANISVDPSKYISIAIWLSLMGFNSMIFGTDDSEYFIIYINWSKYVEADTN